jgi:energy-coupling factor transport system substrate-specific component
MKMGRRELITLALIAAVSIVTKPYVRAPFAFVQAALGLPVGSFIGGVYMLWPVLAGVLVPRPGAVFITCFLQGLVAVLTGFTGLLGQLAFFSYLAPGLVIEGVYLLTRRRWAPGHYLEAVLAGALGNAAGAASNALLFFAVRGLVFTLALGSALLSGGVGGWVAYLVAQRLPKGLRPAAR